jgi:hypothetical protein
MAIQDWNIQGRAHSCQACNKAFTDKQAYHTLLFDNKQLLERMDICDACWQNKYSQSAHDRKGFVSLWQGIYEAPPPPAPEPIQKENAETLLRKLMELNDPKYSAASYILAVMLERKRLLKIQQQFTRDGRRIFVYEHTKSGDLFTIPDPDLQLDQLGQVQAEVAQLMEHGLEGAAAATAAPPDAAQVATPEPTAQPTEQADSASAPKQEDNQVDPG